MTVPIAPDDATERYVEMMGRYLGPVVLRAFADDDVTEVYVNPRDGAVRLDSRLRGRVLAGVYLAPERVETFLNAVASRQGAMLGPESPRLEAELPQEIFGGSRLQGFVPPVTPGPAFVIRKPPTAVYSLDDYVAAVIASSSQCDALRQAVVEHRSVLVAGGTNSGKTTFANALLKEIAERCPQERLVILEDTVELQCAAADHVALRTSPGVGLADLVRSALRASPNRIVVGEVRGAEALDLLDAWATGHPGGVATVHASTAEGALLRLDRLAQRANVPSQRQLVAEAVQHVVVLAGGGRGGPAARRVTELARVDGVSPEGRFLLHHLTEAGTW